MLLLYAMESDCQSLGQRFVIVKSFCRAATLFPSGQLARRQLSLPVVARLA